MQIDLIITELDVGGAEQTLSRLAIGLQEQGDDVRVFSFGRLPQPDRGGEDRIVAELRDRDVSLTSGGATNTTSFPRVAWDLRRWLGKRPNAVRQSFLYHANVLTNLVDATPTRAKRRFAGIRVADPSRGRLWFEKTAMRRASQIVCVSSAVESFVQQEMGIEPHRTTVIPNSVDVDRFANAAPMDWRSVGWPADAKVVIFIGRLHPQKNIELLQRSFHWFADSDESTRLLLIGDGPQRKSLEHWAESISGDRVRLMPWQADVAPYIAASRVLVLPSHYEGMPNVVMEAMASAKPVVCSGVEGSKELIGVDTNQVFEPGDGPEMAKKLNAFLLDENTAVSTGLRNQKRMRDFFSVQSMVNAYRRLYQDCDRVP